MFDDEYIKALPDDDIDSLVTLTHDFSSMPLDKLEMNDYVQVYAILNSLCSNALLDIKGVDFTGDFKTDVDRVRAYIGKISTKAKLVQVTRNLNIEEEKFKSIREDIYEYEFREDDYNRLQELINDMRDLIANSDDIDERHKARLLNRLEALQSELHKRVTNLDKALGFLLDVSIIVKQTGEGAKPIADLAKEISKIITQVIFVSTGIPPGELPPLLK